MIRRVSFSASEWTGSILLILMTTALAIVCGVLKRENERLRRSNWELEGAVGRPPGTAISWLPRAAIASILLPCVGYFAVSTFLVMARAREAAAQLSTVARVRVAKVRFTAKAPPPATQVSGAGERLRGGGCDLVAPSRVWNHLEAVAEKEHLSTNLLQAVIFRESSFHPCAVSSSGALGLMQLMPGTAAELGVQDPFDPRQNIDAGARFLGDLMVRYRGDAELALAAYHSGPATVDAHGSVPPIPKTRTYVNDVMGLAGFRRPNSAPARSSLGFSLLE